ncbi:RRXRR domain-containing protein [Nonomuraea sp. NBC_00507]|uniref:RRXRR domain-containing protein n=1 Tax=Nonomuraea sp. NBC_00507 TaxID=2976002 RepID=UPI002E198006
MQLDHRGGRIRDRLAARAALRRRRRGANLRYRAPRFLNRARPQGWLAPSLRHRVDTNITTAHGTVHRHVRLLQRGDGYAYHHQREGSDDAPP